MAKAKTSAKTSTVKVGNTTVKGATAADREQIAAAKASVKADAERAPAARENTKTGVAAPEAQDSPRARRDAAQKLFDKADEEGRATIIAETAARSAALGY